MVSLLEPNEVLTVTLVGLRDGRRWVSGYLYRSGSLQDTEFHFWVLPNRWKPYVIFRDIAVSTEMPTVFRDSSALNYLFK